MLIWGWKTFVTRLTVLFAVCAYCRHEGAQTIDEWRTKFTFFFIPTFTTSTKYVQQCTMCAAQTQVSKEHATSAAVPQQAQAGARGADVLIQLAMTPDEMTAGSIRQLPIETGIRCEPCSGRGGSGSATCQACAGQGRVRATRTIDARIPAGAAYGTRIRLAGEGEVGPNGGQAGDVYLELVPPH